MMQAQPDLWDHVPAETLTHKERFERFHLAHPEVYRDILELVQSIAKRGRTARVRDIMGYLRTFRALSLPLDDLGYALNNNHSPYYARLIIERHPELEEWISVRERRAS